MTHAITQAAVEAAKAVIMSVRIPKTSINNARLIQHHQEQAVQL